MHIAIELQEKLIRMYPQPLVEAGPCAYGKPGILRERLEPARDPPLGLAVVLQRSKHSE